MIVISDCSKDIIIPAGLGDNPGVVYDVAGVKSLNGQQGDLTLKTVNGNDMLGDGNIEIKGGVETVNGETGDVKIKTVNGQSLMGEGDVPVDVGVETLNGQKGNLKIKSVNGSDMLGEGNVVIDTGVESLNGQKGALTLKTVNGNELTGDGNIEIQAGSDNVIVLDGLTQEERKAVYDKLDKTKAPDEVFVYEGKTSVRAYWDYGNYLKFITFNDNYNGLKVDMFSLDPDGNLGYEDRGMTYTNSVLMHLGSHVEESGYFECMYIGNFFEYILRPYTRPNACFINLEKGIGDSTRPIYAPVSTLVEKYGDRNNVRMQFIANEKLYTFLLDPNQDNKWLFESAKPITGGGATNALTYKQITNENRQEVYDDVKAHWSDASGYTGNYVYFYQKDKDQIIFDEVKFENNEAYFNSAAINFTSGQVHNPLIRLLCCIVRAEGNVELAENRRVISDINGMRYICGGVINDGDSISFRTNNYGDGYDIYESTNTGGRDGMFDAQFENGIEGYKGNTPANIFTDGTDVFMAFDVVDNHYVYKKVDNSWAFVSKTKIGGVQSSEVSNIKVLTQAEYDGLTAKDENVLYCIKG